MEAEQEETKLRSESDKQKVKFEKLKAKQDYKKWMVIDRSVDYDNYSPFSLSSDETAVGIRMKMD